MNATEMTCAGGKRSGDCTQRLHWDREWDRDPATAIRCLDCGTLMCPRCAREHFAETECKDRAIERIGDSEAEAIADRDEARQRALDFERSNNSLRAKLAETESALANAAGQVASLRDALCTLRAAATRAVPYLVSCIHEIACAEEHDDGECPGETMDEPVRLLREGIAAARKALETKPGGAP